MVGWIEQWYFMVPTVFITTVLLAPAASIPASNESSSATGLCGIESVFVKVTVPPFFTVTIIGEKTKLVMVILALSRVLVLGCVEVLAEEVLVLVGSLELD
jgi:hypothetical protein